MEAVEEGGEEGGAEGGDADAAGDGGSCRGAASQSLSLESQPTVQDAYEQR